MFGWIHEALRQLVIRKYGLETYLKILDIAKLEDGTERELSKNYRDEETYRLVSAIGSVIGISVDDVWELYGSFLLQYTMESGWNELLRALSTDFRGFLEGLDALHYFIDHVVYKAKLKGPSFRCEEQPNGDLHLHYYSRRQNLYPIVKGVVREAARRLFNIEIIIKVHEKKQEHGDSLLTEHIVFSITQVNNNNDDHSSLFTANKLIAENSSELINKSSNYPIKMIDFCHMLPHHIVFNKKLVVEHVGNHMKKTFPFIKRGETKLSDILHLTHPEIPLTFDAILTFQNSMFVFQMKELGSLSPANLDLTISQFPVTLKGSMIGVQNNNYLIFMCSLNVTSIRELVDRNLYISDIQRHDSTRDLIMLNQSRISQVELNRRLEETTRNLKLMAAQLETEKTKTEELLCELMPASVAETLRSGNTVEACDFAEATILFTDIVTFTNICSLCTAYDVVNLLNDLYLRFDRLVGLHDVYKVETIGDAYLVCGGVPNESINHAEKVLDASIGFLMESKFVLSPITRQAIKIRVGVHSGSVVAGVVGIKMPRYCLFGDTVSIANKMESGGVPCCIHVSESAKNLALKTNQGFEFKERGLSKIEAKGVPMYTYFLEKNNKRSVWELCGRERSPNHSIDGYAELHQESGLGSANPATKRQSQRKKELIINGNAIKKEHQKKSKIIVCSIL